MEDRKKGTHLGCVEAWECLHFPTNPTGVFGGVIGAAWMVLHVR